MDAINQPASLNEKSSFQDNAKDKILIVKTECERHVGLIRQIDRIPNSRNYVYKIQTDHAAYIYKAYNTAARGSSDTEIWAYTQLTGCSQIKKVAYQHIGLPHNYIITDYLDGINLSDVTAASNDSMTANYLALQIVSLIKACEQLNTQRYGRFSQNGVGSDDCWSTTLLNYLKNLIARASSLATEHRNFLLENLYVIQQYFAATSARLNAKKPVLTPVDLNLHNFIVDDQHRLTFIDLESFWSGDILLAVGDFVGNTYNTLLYSAFIEHWGALAPEDKELVHAYALLSNLSALICIAESQADELASAQPWGNPHTYFSLIDEHKKKLHSFLTNSGDQVTTIKHFSARNADTFFKPCYLGREAQFCRLSELTRSLRRFCNVEFNRLDEQFYVLIYGSYAYGMAQPSSDLDIVFVADESMPGRRDRIKQFILSLHERYGLRKDNEIPYDKKVLFSFTFMEKACAGEGIYCNAQWGFPPIIKDKDYLSSDALLFRFAQGMLANPHLFLDGDHLLYSAHRKCATFNLIKAILSQHKIKQISAIGLLEKFCIDTQGNTGDFYLGFSYREPFKSYLSEYLEAVLSSVKRPAAIGPNGAEYQFSDAEIAQRSKVTDFFACPAERPILSVVAVGRRNSIP